MRDRNYLATLEQQLEDLAADKKSGPEGLSLMRQIDSARSQVANAEQEIAQAEEDEEARRKFDAEHGALPEGVPGDCEPEPELEDGANILDAIDEEYRIRPIAAGSHSVLHFCPACLCLREILLCCAYPIY